MKKSQAYYDLYEYVRSKRRVSDSFLKKHWPYHLTDKEEQRVLQQVMLVGRKVKSLAMVLKWLVQLHIMVVTKCEEIEFLTEELLAYALPNQLKFESSNKETGLYDLMSNRVTRPYLQYIQKRCMKSQLIKTNPPKTESDEDLLQRSFELINLLNAGCSFCKELYKFGRYYSEEYPFMLDLNIVLGMDLRQAYNALHVSIYRLWQRWNTLDPEFQSWLNSLIEQINCLNENMYIVYYNTYNYSELKSYLPNWVRLEPKEIKWESPVRNTRRLSKDEGKFSTAVSCKRSFESEDWRAEFSVNLESILNRTGIPTRAQYEVEELDMVDASDFHLDQSSQPLNA